MPPPKKVTGRRAVNPDRRRLHLRQRVRDRGRITGERVVRDIPDPADFAVDLQIRTDRVAELDAVTTATSRCRRPTAPRLRRSLDRTAARRRACSGAPARLRVRDTTRRQHRCGHHHAQHHLHRRTPTVDPRLVSRHGWTTMSERSSMVRMPGQFRAGVLIMHPTISPTLGTHDDIGEVQPPSGPIALVPWPVLQNPRPTRRYSPGPPYH